VARLLSARGVDILSKSHLRRTQHENPQVAHNSSLCYSLEDRIEQWSIPVAV